MDIFNKISSKIDIPEIEVWIKDLNQSSMFGIFRRDYLSKRKITIRYYMLKENIPEKDNLRNFINRINSENFNRYNTKLYNETSTSALNVIEVKPKYDSNPEVVDGRIIIRDNFHHMFESIPE